LAYLKRALALRRQFKTFLHRARFMDNVGLTAPADLQAKWFTAPGGANREALIFFVNANRRPGLEVALSGMAAEAGQKATVYALDVPARSLALTNVAGTVRLIAPTEELSAVWIGP
jgi:hypothetical protein